MKKLAIITTHPIQYYAPVFQLLQERKHLEVMVFYTWGEQGKSKYDPGFGAAISWDVPLLDGYPYSWVKNMSKAPGSHHFMGIVNPGLVGQVSAWNPDSLLVIGWAYQSHLQCLRHFSGRIPVYFRGDSILLDKPTGVKGWLRSIFLKWVYRHVDFAFYVGTKNKAYYKRYGLKDGQLVFAPHAVDNKRFSADLHDQAAEWRSALGVGKDEVLVAFAGKFEEIKQVGLLISAFIQLNDPAVHLLLAGNGPLETGLRQMAAQSSCAQNIHFIGFRNQSAMPAVYQACDLFCLPSRSETWGLAVNEAMACGRAVLVSDHCGCAADLVRDGFNGRIFKSGDRQDLISCLHILSRSRQKLSDLGVNSRSMIHDWNFLKIAEAIEKKMAEKTP